jgi:mannitol/fructose-specific phosphotransferase system IIA component (Ntr-type)
MGRDKQAVLRELVHLVADGGKDQFEDILRAVQAREAVLSTGIGYGVAIPHGKSPLVADLRLAAGRAAAPVPFDALDGEPVQLFFLLVGPESAAGPHIKALSRISRLVRREPFRQRLLAAQDAEAFYRCLCEAEQGP